MRIEPSPTKSFAHIIISRSASEKLKARGALGFPRIELTGTQLTHDRWSARLYQSKSSDSSAGRAGQPGPPPFVKGCSSPKLRPTLESIT
jgi:hypothetical protein